MTRSQFTRRLKRARRTSERLGRARSANVRWQPAGNDSAKAAPILNEANRLHDTNLIGR